MDYRLTILIPTLPQRKHFYDRLRAAFACQILETGLYVKFIEDDDTSCSIGVKRERMKALVNTPYMEYFDDDDLPGPNHIAKVFEGIEKGVDCCSLHGIITTDGANPKHFYHSIQYTEMFERDNVYYRPPNHINCIKTELAQQCVFPDWQRSEDSNFCFQLRDKGLLKTEHVIDEVIYNYLYVSDKRY